MAYRVAIKLNDRNKPIWIYFNNLDECMSLKVIMMNQNKEHLDKMNNLVDRALVAS